MNGAEKALSQIDVHRWRGVEIGPLMTPLIRREDGDVRYIDRAPTAELRRWYSSDPKVDLNKIVEVDYVWDEKPLSQCLGGEVFDYCVGSHVVEHIPDVITWLQEIAVILRPGGVLSLVVPDKRYTFDILRRTSALEDVVAAFVSRLRKPSPRQIFDHFSHFTEVDTVALWDGKVDVESLRPEKTGAAALAIAREAHASGKYIDSHCWVFTPDSFLALLKEIDNLGLLDFDVAAFFPTEKPTLEFHVSLRRR